MSIDHRLADRRLASAAQRSDLAALADQLRDGPLQQLVELHARIAALTDSLEHTRKSSVEELEPLVRLSVSTMAHFNAFTREFATVLRGLTDGHAQPH